MNRFDVLADLVAGLRLTAHIHGQIALGAPWALGFDEPAFAAIYLTIDGSAELVTDAGTWQLAPGDLALMVRPGPHVLRSDAHAAVHPMICRASGGSAPRGGDGPRTRLVAGAFRSDTWSPSDPKGSPLLAHLPPVVQIPAASLGAAGAWVAEESASDAPGAGLILSRLVEILFVQVLRTLTTEGHGLCALADPHIGRALGEIHAHPEAPWSLTSLATAAGMSRSRFAARFHELVGEPPGTYLTRRRMERATELLRDERLSVAEVAGRVGYASEASLNRAFTRWVGRGPGAWRRSVL